MTDDGVNFGALRGLLEQAGRNIAALRERLARAGVNLEEAFRDPPGVGDGEAAGEAE
jgi:hypothetical protein